MPESIKYRIGVGKANDDITVASPPLQLPAFTFDRTDITFDSILRRFDEI